MPLGTKPVDWAVSAEKRGSVVDVGQDERLAGAEHPAGDARPGREAAPDEGVLALADDGLEHELVGRLVEQEHAGRAGVEDRPGHLDDRLEQRAVGAVVGEHARRDGVAQAIGRQPSGGSGVRGGEPEQRLHLGRGEVGVLGPDQGADRR